MIRLSIVVIVLILGVHSAYAQGTDLDPYPRNCEDGAVGIRWQINEFRERASPDDVMVLVARLGDGERSGSINRRRLHNVVTALMVLGLKADQVVVAVGGRTSGYGRIEFYWEGRPKAFLAAQRGKDICVACCGPDDRYYPDKDSHRKVKRSSARRP